jgi:hypothetical protein
MNIQEYMHPKSISKKSNVQKKILKSIFDWRCGLNQVLEHYSNNGSLTHWE